MVKQLARLMDTCMSAGSTSDPVCEKHTVVTVANE